MTITPKQLSTIHQAFWAAEREATERRMQDRAVCIAALARIGAEVKRQVPIRYQSSWESSVAAAHADARFFRSDLARRGGRAEKTDALQRRIRELAKADPEMTTDTLRCRLEAEQCPGGLIDDMDNKAVYFVNRGKSKKAAISGLKHRLARARKKLREN